MAWLVPRIAECLASGGRILELGSGSGRDAAALLASGFDVVATDGSEAMLAEAARLHPQLSGRLARAVLPGPLPFPTATFDGVLAMAVLMHLPASELPAAFAEIARVLKPASVLYFTVSAARPGLDAAGRDQHGRLFTALSESQWRQLAEQTGFEVQPEAARRADSLARSDVQWWSFLGRKRGGRGEGR